LHLFSAPEVRAIAGFTGQTVRQVLEAFWAAGLRTLPGGGAEVLSDRVRRRLSPLKGTPEEWLDVLRTAHQIGFRTTATLMYGHVEEDEDIIEHLLRLRGLQDEALAPRAPRPESPAESPAESEPGSFFAFIPWSFKPGQAPLSRWVPEEAGGARYLRILAVSRLVLDNFPHIQASWFSEGEKTGALALRFGADDFGGTLIEENVLKAANHTTRTTTDRVVRLIRAAGYTPVERNTTYEPLRIYQGDAA
jgi:cyclic dehypoxanthinyl futalosine synthase